jgi:hypothetical protein
VALRGPFDSAQGRLLKRRSSTVVLAAIEVHHFKSKVKSSGQSVRSTRTAPDFARWTAEGGCPHMSIALTVSNHGFRVVAFRVIFFWIIRVDAGVDG